MDRHGNTVAQAELIPMQLGRSARRCAPASSAIPFDTLNEGDFLINNDRSRAASTFRRLHLHPIFVGGRVVGFSARGAPSRSRRWRARPQHPCQRRLSGGHPLPAQQVQLPDDWNGGSSNVWFTANVRVPDLTSRLQCAVRRECHRVVLA